MDALNQLEIQNIRHLVGMLSNVGTKIGYYKTISTDENLHKLFDAVTNNANDLKQEISSML